MQNTGTLITAPIRPNDSADLIPSAIDNELKGTLHSCATLSDRNAIITARRSWGMLCVVTNDSTPSNNTTYQLSYGNVDADITNNSNWIVFSPNKPSIPRVLPVVTTLSISPNTDLYDCIDITAQHTDISILNPTGAQVNFQKLIIRIKDDGNIRNITWDTGYASTNVYLPSITFASKIISLGFIYNISNGFNKFQLVALSREP